jgi:hypothetical protein
VIRCWLTDSLHRVFPQSVPEDPRETRLDLVRAERGSFQMVCRTAGEAAAIKASVEAPNGVNVRVRRVGYVPMAHFTTDVPESDIDGLGHLPGLVPDPLFPESTVAAGPFETNSFWVTVEIETTTDPGEHQLTAIFANAQGDIDRMQITINVQASVLPERRNFPVTNWFYANALVDWYQVEFLSEPFWTVLDPYLRNLAGHGQDTIYVPLFTPPLDGDKRPTQLLGVARDEDRYTFDWSAVRRWLDASKAAGLHSFEWTHLFSQWGAAYALDIYEGHGESQRLLWDKQTPAISTTYRSFLVQLLPQFHRFLQTEAVLDRSFFHLSDEPHGEKDLANYRAARELLRELAPWMSIMDALSAVEYAREGLTDVPIALIETFPFFTDEGFPAWAYFCCMPRGRHLNRFLDTPLAKQRMMGWLLYRTGANGFLHWGYNSWYRSQTTELIDPFLVSDAHRWPRWSYGDPFIVYPGPEGPIDSIRWEVFADSLQDYAILQAAGISRDDPLLAEIIDFAEFPRDPAWILATRSELLSRLESNSGVQ